MNRGRDCRCTKTSGGGEITSVPSATGQFEPQALSLDSCPSHDVSRSPPFISAAGPGNYSPLPLKQRVEAVSTPQIWRRCPAQTRRRARKDNYRCTTATLHNILVHCNSITASSGVRQPPSCLRGFDSRYPLQDTPALQLVVGGPLPSVGAGRPLVGRLSRPQSRPRRRTPRFSHGRSAQS